MLTEHTSGDVVEAASVQDSCTLESAESGSSKRNTMAKLLLLFATITQFCLFGAFYCRNFGVGVNFPFSIDVSKLNFDPLFFVVCFISSSANLSTFNRANRQSKCDEKSEECRALFTDQ